MKLYIAETYDELSRMAADIISDELSGKKPFNLGMATGSTPLGLYRQLVQKNRAGQLDLTDVRLFNLDEYYPLAQDHPQSFFSFMKNHVYDPLHLPSHRVFIPNGLAKDTGEECNRYERLIHQHGGIDLQILGVGSNGHIGFNEPGTSFASRTQVVRLADQTIQDNARSFDDVGDVPKQAITMGIGTILESRRIVLLANGEAKAEAMRELFHGKITEQVPVTSLRLHPHVTVIIDQKAAALLNLSLQKK